MLVVDLDGTLVDTRHIRIRMALGKKVHVASETLHDPRPISTALNMVDVAHEAGKHVTVLTARHSDDRAKTVQLLHDLGVAYDTLLMQPSSGPTRLDLVWKREAAATLLRNRAPDTLLAVDDSPYIVDMWEQLHVPVIQIPGWDFLYEGPLEPELPEDTLCLIHQFLTRQ